MPSPMGKDEAVRAERASYYGQIKDHRLAPLWEVLHDVITEEPRTRAKPYVWDYQALRPLLLEAGDIITAKEAERRVLMLENPGLEGEGRITEVLFAGLQLIMPGEIAPAHRHSPSALRFIIEGTGAYTAVEGEKSFMEPGDFIITPSWAWHDHGNEADGPTVWLDGLDYPLVGTLGAMFFEAYGGERFPDGPPPGDSLKRYGANMRPVNDTRTGTTSPIFSYPYERTRETLVEVAKNSDWDPYMGMKLEYIDPTTGGPAMATMATHMQLLPKGFKTERYQATDASVYAVVEGRGRTIVGDGEAAVTLEWKPRDIFVIPNWQPHRFEADEESFLFSFSDKPIQAKFGLWRERRGNA